MNSSQELREALIGKTVKGSSFHEAYLCLFFNDGTHQIFEAEASWDGDKVIGLIKDDELSNYDQWKLGIITESEYKEKTKKKDDEEAKRRLILERQQYEQLKKKFDVTEKLTSEVN